MSDVLVELTAFVTDTRDVVSRFAATTAAALGRSAVPGRADLVDLEPQVRAVLGRREELLHGGGFVAAPHVLADAPWWLEWFAWDAGAVQRLVPETDPAGAHFFDYTLMPWYSGPRDHPDGPAVITGPYVDYLCTDDYTLTFTEPVAGPDGGFAGVAGVDVRVSAVEQRFLAALRAAPGPLALVNELGRVVVSNSAAMISGDLVTDLDVPDLAACGDPRLTRIAGSELALLDPAAAAG
jgi:hypothetical protein